MTVQVISGSSRRLTSIRLARVGNISAASMPVSSSSSRRGSAERKASMARMGVPAISRSVLPSGFLPAEVVGERARRGHDLEGGIGDRLADAVVDGELGASVRPPRT